MKRTRHSKERIIAILKEHEAGVKTADLCWHRKGLLFSSFVLKRKRIATSVPMSQGPFVRAIGRWLDQRPIASTAVYTAMALNRFEHFWPEQAAVSSCTASATALNRSRTGWRSPVAACLST